MALRASGAIVVILSMSACTDLGAVRDFAKLSSETAAYRGVVQAYAAHPTRMTRYRPSLAHVYAAQRAQREAQREGLIALQETLTTYMTTLGALAADEAVTFRTNPLVQAASKVGAIEPSAVASVTAIGDLLFRAAANAWRQREVARIIGDANAPIQSTINDLRTFVVAVGDEDRAERESLDQFYGVLERRSSDAAARQAVREWREWRDEQVIARSSGREAYLKALETIGRGHQLLYENRTRLSAEETIRQIRAVEAELRVAAELLRPLLPI
jgi:hypothetical protein